jgi:hypothetical protein
MPAPNMAAKKWVRKVIINEGLRNFVKASAEKEADDDAGDEADRHG